MISSITVADLESSYNEATKNNGIIALLARLREPSTVIKINELNHCFNSPQWIESPSGGHRKITHRVTKVVIEYQNHGSQDVKKSIQKQILDNAQEHLDILCDHIFKFSNIKWREAPNYNRALQNYNVRLQSRSRTA